MRKSTFNCSRGDNPVERMAVHLAANGWTLTQQLYGRACEYKATRGDWTVIVHPACLGLRADLLVRPSDGVWIIGALCGREEYARVCRLLGISPSDLWRRGIFDGLGVAA